MDYPFSIIIDEYVYILTRLGVTISSEVKKWLDDHKTNPIPHYRFLHFITINHAMQFTRSLVNNFQQESDIKITQFDKIAFSLSLYFHYQQFSQHIVLKNWLLTTTDPISLELVYIKKMFLNIRNIFTTQHN